MHSILFRQRLPQTLFSILPALLFFPIGIIYTGLVLFLLAWLASGNVAAMCRNLRSSPVLVPSLVLLAIVFLSAVFLSADNSQRWSALVHYQIYIFLLLFISIGGGQWQIRAKKVFFMGAVYGASMFYLTHLDVMPDWVIFRNYAIYSGNKSISLGIFLAIAAAWMLNEALYQTSRRLKAIHLMCYFFVAPAILFLAMTRTGIVLLLVLSVIVVIRHIQLNLKGLAMALFTIACIAAAWQLSSVVQSRSQATADAVRAFSKGEMGTGQGNRLQFIKITGQMILEKPILGFGVGGWLQQYPIRAQGLETAEMRTPHNDYLLYAADLGMVGLLALLAFHLALLRTAWKFGGKRGMALLLPAVALIVGSLFNAMLRDWKFGIPMMILLAISLADNKSEAPAEFR